MKVRKGKNNRRVLFLIFHCQKCCVFIAGNGEEKSSIYFGAQIIYF